MNELEWWVAGDFWRFLFGFLGWMYVGGSNNFVSIWVSLTFFHYVFGLNEAVGLSESPIKMACIYSVYCSKDQP